MVGEISSKLSGGFLLNKFEVTHKPTKYGFVVDLEKRTCSCLEFQMLGLPCRHAIAAASFRNIEYALFASQYLVKDTWSETVKGIILPVQNPEDINIPADILKVDLYPPKMKRTKGRPGIKRKLGASDYAEGPRKKKKLNKCSRCFKEGHKKTTCKPVP
ncbi:hypothetical protein F2Q68_00031683 [Brassica cretica]|uniref:SWIM-type domain-containing protein n=1 Tax=Brassica cretica TaxID=69181 RepID=A0A8S9GIT8_BRACR|nr:hypothetical protein F2Q68_00031683 [Brassica cretica]